MEISQCLSLSVLLSTLPLRVIKWKFRTRKRKRFALMLGWELRIKPLLISWSKGEQTVQNRLQSRLGKSQKSDDAALSNDERELRLERVEAQLFTFGKWGCEASGTQTNGVFPITCFIPLVQTRSYGVKFLLPGISHCYWSWRNRHFPRPSRLPPHFWLDFFTNVFTIPSRTSL